MFVPGVSRSPSDVSKVLDIFSLVMVRQDRDFDPNVVNLVSCRFLRNDRDEFLVSGIPVKQSRSFLRFYTRWKD